ncbi:TIGR02281 family clan AA aspartic protease [Xinfangfangia sp. CPCC 101601]|uniref:TIGR02281 family clan AA aspartic protease n=1 Tax=Pseudogemmobacter lacusdianii TaxID=3069608 RepID=A0ABU0VV36_9RHOB|nr:TIGR02281 family clan AA aspartic protease [Xinfangfangia sp. CPCC 101601]MDQ2065602.1 TIGR02281 family clan AA aspartic protease [Xinfangfangia sp. CPCC 101601]
MDGDSIARLGYLALLLAAVGGWVIVEYRSRMGQALRVAAAWGLIILGLMAAYGLWNDIRGPERPQAQVTTENGKVELKRGADGHYYATLRINGHDIFFMADTGASMMVLTQRDAQALGFDPEDLLYLGQASTANGTVRTAHVTLDEVTLGPFTDPNVSAWVNEGALDISLLGMEYLGRFRIEITGDRMILSR